LDGGTFAMGYAHPEQGAALCTRGREARAKCERSSPPPFASKAFDVELDDVRGASEAATLKLASELRDHVPAPTSGRIPNPFGERDIQDVEGLAQFRF
jgi:hypothetical protein